MGMQLLPTYHPAYLLRNPERKRDVWEDMKLLEGAGSDDPVFNGPKAMAEYAALRGAGVTPHRMDLRDQRDVSAGLDPAERSAHVGR